MNLILCIWSKWMKNKKGGYRYYVSKEKIREYSKWPIEKLLKWLSQFNELRKYYPKEIIEKQDKFRRGEI